MFFQYFVTLSSGKKIQVCEDFAQGATGYFHISLLDYGREYPYPQGFGGYLDIEGITFKYTNLTREEVVGQVMREVLRLESLNL